MSDGCQIPYTLNDCVDGYEEGGGYSNCGGNFLLGIIWLGGRVDFVRGRLAAISRNECIWTLKNQIFTRFLIKTQFEICMNVRNVANNYILNVWKTL